MQLADLSKRMLVTIGVLSLVFMGAAALYYRSLACLPFVLGVFLGAAVSAAKVLLLARTVNRAVDMDKKPAAGYVYLQHLLRLALTGAVLLLGALSPALNLWGAAAGVMTYQLAVYSLKFTAKS